MSQPEEPRELAFTTTTGDPADHGAEEEVRRGARPAATQLPGTDFFSNNGSIVFII